MRFVHDRTHVRGASLCDQARQMRGRRRNAGMRLDEVDHIEPKAPGEIRP